MAQKVYLVQWNEPSKHLKGETVMKWYIFAKKEDAQKKYDEANRIKDATNIELQETEATSM